MIAFFSIASLVVIVGIVGIVNSLHVYASLNVVTNDPLRELLVSNNIQSSVNKISSDIVGFALVSPVTKQLHQQRLQQLIQDSNIMARLVDQLDKMVSADHREKTESDPMLKHLTSEYSTVSLQLINSKYNGMNEQSILNLISSADNLRDKIDMVINKRINMENTEIQNEITKGANSIHTQQAEIIIASIAACAASIAIGRQISLNSIIKPLLKLKQATVQIAHGDFSSTELKSFARDEIGELSVQFESMRQTLNQRTKELESSNTQLSLANEQLKVNDKMQRDFINIAAHELRTPIEPILLGSEQLKDVLPNEEIVSIIFRNAKKLQALANGILDAARIESGTLRLYKGRVNIKDIISDALQIIYGGRLYDKDGRLNIIYEPQDIFIEADKDRMTQVVCNLLNNAVKFINKEQGVISVITQRKEGEDSEVIVTIKDTGKGIDPDIMPRLFTKFASITSEIGGTGLGLFISKSIVEAHGGRIWAENNPDRKGATFSFSLPIVNK